MPGTGPGQGRWEGAYLRECLLQCCIGCIQVVIDDHQVKQARLLAWGGTRDRVRNTGSLAPSGLAPLLTTCSLAMATLAAIGVGWPGLLPGLQNSSFLSSREPQLGSAPHEVLTTKV